MKAKQFSTFSAFLLLFCCLLMSAQDASAQTFEGKIVMKTSAGDGQPDMTLEYFTKNKMGRFSVQQNGMNMGMLMRDQTIFVILDEMQSYMEMPIKGTKSDSKSNDDGDIKKTGEIKTICGYKCEKWTLKGKDDSGELWVTSELGNFGFMDAIQGEADPMQEKIRKAMGDNFFPMEIHATEKGGPMKKVLEVLEVKKQTLDKSMFEIPTGYSKMSMPNGMK